MKRNHDFAWGVIVGIIATMLFVLAVSCSSIKGLGTEEYVYEYREINEQVVKTTTDWVLYLPGDTINFYPSGRKIVIISTSIGGTKLKL